MARKHNLQKVAIENFGKCLPDLLQEMYWDKGMRQREIAEVLGCTVPAISMWFSKLKIQVKANGTFQKGAKRPQSVVEIIRRTHTGKTVSAETRRRIAASRVGKSPIGKSERFQGKRRRSDGYIHIYKPEHPFASKDGYVMEHRLIMEEKIERILQPEEEVHHINHKKDDNRPENLHLFASKQEHMRFHMTQRHEERRRKNVH